EVQPGDEPVPYFSYWKDDLFHVEHSEHRLAKSQGRAGQPSQGNGKYDRDASVPRGTFPTPGGSDASQGQYPPGSILEQNRGQLPCYITYTTDETATIIRANLDKSPMYSGVIQGVGPR